HRFPEGVFEVEIPAEVVVLGGVVGGCAHAATSGLFRPTVSAYAWTRGGSTRPSCRPPNAAVSIPGRRAGTTTGARAEATAGIGYPDRRSGRSRREPRPHAEERTG